MSLRIAFLHPDLGLGGAERLVVDAASGLSKLVCTFPRISMVLPREHGLVYCEGSLLLFSWPSTGLSLVMTDMILKYIKNTMVYVFGVQMVARQQLMRASFFDL